MTDKREVETLVQERALYLVEAILKKLAVLPPGVPIPGCAIVVNQDGVEGLLGIPLQQMEFRIPILQQHAAAFGTVAFGLVFDGYIYEQCLVCHGQGCERCATRDHRKYDALITVVRTKWGFAHTTAVAYGYDAAGHFELHPHISVPDSMQGQILDGYGVVFGEAVH